MVVGYQYSTRDLATTRTNSTEKGIAFLQRDLLFTDDEKKHFFESVFARMNVCVCVGAYEKNASSQSAFFVKMLNRLVVVVGSHLVAAPPLNWTELTKPNYAGCSLYDATDWGTATATSAEEAGKESGIRIQGPSFVSLIYSYAVACLQQVPTSCTAVECSFLFMGAF